METKHTTENPPAFPSAPETFIAKIEKYSDALMADWKKCIVASFSFWPPTAWRAEARMKIYGEIANDLQNMVDEARATLNREEGYEKVSSCCGSRPVGASEDMGLCPSCRDHCEYEDSEQP
jgi:uncharacterized Fe-S cluster-containing MiaB family protein